MTGERSLAIFKELHSRLSSSLRDNTPGSAGPSATEVAEALCELLSELGGFCNGCGGTGETWRGTCRECSGRGH